MKSQYRKRLNLDQLSLKFQRRTTIARVLYLLMSIVVVKANFHFFLSVFFCLLATSGINSEKTYSIQTDSSKNSSEYFHIDEVEGAVYLKVKLKWYH